MKRTLLFFGLTLFIFCSCQQKETPEQSVNEISKIENLLEQYAIALEKEDLEMVEKTWKNKDDIIMFGTDSHERLKGWEKVRKAYLQQFKEIDNTFIAISDQVIRTNPQNDLGWFSQSMKYNFMEDSIAHSFENLRFTGVVQKDEDDNWKLVQGHLSMPASVNIGK